MILFDAPLKIEAAAGTEKKGPRRFEMLAYNGGPLMVKGYRLPVVIDLEGLSVRSDQLPTYYGHHDGHDGSKLIGHSDVHNTTNGQLVVRGVFSGVTSYTSEVLESHDNGYEWQASVGANPERGGIEEVRAGESVVVNGRRLVGPLMVARKSVLRHIAVLPEGADSETKLSIAATRKGALMTFEEYVSAAYGGDVPDLTDRQTAILQAHYAAGGDTINAASRFDTNAVEATHAKYVEAIEAKAATYSGKIDAAKMEEITAKASADGQALLETALSDGRSSAWLAASLSKPESQAAVELIRAERPTAPAIHGSSRDKNMNPTILEAALSINAGLQEPEKYYKPEVLEAATTPEFRHYGLQQLILAQAIGNGYRISAGARIHQGNVREVLQFAYPSRPIQASGVSTLDVSGILSNSANKMLLSGFELVPQTWREVAGIGNVSDFKQATRYRLTADLEYEQIAPSGEIKHGTLSEESYTVQAKTYAKMLGLTRQDIINDDIGAFDDLRTRLGMGAAMKMNRVFWTLWINNAAFFTEARGNRSTGSGSALGEAGLNNAVKLFRSMKGPDGNHLDIPPDRIIVPPTLESSAKKWYKSTEVRDTTTSTKTPVANIHEGSFRPVPVPQLEDEDFTGYSATAWYMLCNPAILATAVMCFLNGQQSPTIESADADFNTLGIQLRGYHDFGVAFAEYRAGVANDGA